MTVLNVTTNAAFPALVVQGVVKTTRMRHLFGPPTPSLLPVESTTLKSGSSARAEMGELNRHSQLKREHRATQS